MVSSTSEATSSITRFSPQPSAISLQPSAFSLNSASLISQHPQQCRGFTFLRHRLHLRLTRLSIRTFQAHEAQHFLMRIPAGFITKPKLEPSGEFLRLLKRLSLHTAENFSALSDLSLSCFPAIRSGWSRFIFCFILFFTFKLLNFVVITSAKVGIKKTPQHRWNVLGKIWECLGTFGKKLGKIWEKLS